MSRYANKDDKNGFESVAMWKPNEEYPRGVLSSFIESGTDDAPSLECEDLDGTKYTLHGAWRRNVLKCVKQWGDEPLQWENAVITPSKNGRQLELVPVKSVVIEERVA